MHQAQGSAGQTGDHHHSEQCWPRPVDQGEQAIITCTENDATTKTVKYFRSLKADAKKLQPQILLQMIHVYSHVQKNQI